MDQDLAELVVEAAARGVASGATSANGHRNVSIRPAGADEMYFTAGPPLRGHPISAVVRVGLDGILRGGDLPPIQRAVVAMHPAMYADRPDVGCVLHTRSLCATAYAVARRPVGCWIEAQAMFGVPGGVPVAGYGPRGSDEALANIRRGCPGRTRRPAGQPRRSRVPSHAGTGRPERRGGRGGRPGGDQRECLGGVGGDPAAPIRHRTDVMPPTLVAVPVVPEGF